jgi:hypothetical protein
LPLPKPPLQVKVDNIAEEKNKPQPHKSESVEEKIATLSTYRMARGLCRKCGKKWARGHQCVASV